MPRDAGGNYTLPSGNPVVTGTVITSTWANPTMSDIASEITNSLSRNGQGGMLVPFQFFDGTENAPGITFTNEPTAGMYRPGNGEIGIASQGVTIGLFKAATGNIAVEGADPIADEDLTRKDYVDALVADAIAAVQEANWPVGSSRIGPDPTGTLPGDWTQLPEGTFLMNTIAGADTGGGSNDAILVGHDHPSAPHGHTADPVANHTHPLDDQFVGDDSDGGNGDPRITPGTNNGNTKGAGGHTPQINDGVAVIGAVGESGTDKNKPLYVGVEVWERTA